jgi:hypothetical protein
MPVPSTFRVRLAADLPVQSAREAGGKPAVVFAQLGNRTRRFAGVFNGSDGTRTRDLRRDRPSRAPRHLATNSSERRHLQALCLLSQPGSAWLSQPSSRRLGHEWAHGILSLWTTARLCRRAVDSSLRGDRYWRGQGCAGCKSGLRTFVFAVCQGASLQQRHAAGGRQTGLRIIPDRARPRLRPWLPA